MDPIEERNERWSFGILLPTIAETMQEQHLSKAQALKLLNRMLGPAERPPSVVSAIRRLEMTDEDQFQLMLGQESLEALDLLD